MYNVMYMCRWFVLHDIIPQVNMLLVFTSPPVDMNFVCVICMLPFSYIVILSGLFPCKLGGGGGDLS